MTISQNSWISQSLNIMFKMQKSNPLPPPSLRSCVCVSDYLVVPSAHRRRTRDAFQDSLPRDTTLGHYTGAQRSEDGGSRLRELAVDVIT